ncbi:response regulator transcription factor [Yinghuangia soli]|uniref:Response regulator transcription factor n=1 Tax=Yinghuangia soli TaxID=2908204 RepID=A0AA41Q034_9ACTN|nr:response regulator transcription factor [Yinghuangia soli]MCF2529099.1 response regulator transcription factor [Yinghuangia soli]
MNEVADDLRILLAEDDDVIREATALALQRYGFQVGTVADGLAALEVFRTDPPDVVVTDVMMPGLDGVGLTRRIRETSTVPIIMITARADPIDMVSGLEAGADDYITKPFESGVLVARIRAVMRRSGPPATTPPPAAHSAPAAPGSAAAFAAPGPPAAEPSGAVRVVGDLEVDTDALQVRVDGVPVQLTPTEMRLLLEFTAAPGVVLDRDTLLERVWDYQWGGDTRVVDVHVQRLRGKIGADRIETVRGFGYKLRR